MPPQIQTSIYEPKTLERSAQVQEKKLRQPSVGPKLWSDLRYIVSLFLATRLALTLIGLMAHSITETGYGKQFSWSPFTWLDIWGVWDSFWYMDIVQNGYSVVGAIPDSPEQTNFPFFRSILC